MRELKPYATREQRTSARAPWLETVVGSVLDAPVLKLVADVLPVLVTVLLLGESSEDTCTKVAFLLPLE